MPDNIDWGSIADWVSGLGSLSAGVIALYLARASERIRLKGNIGLRAMVGLGQPQVDLISISVTNVGTRATVISNIGFTVGRFKGKRHGIIMAMRDVYSVGIPFALADGQQAHWGFPMGEDRKWLRELCGNFIKTDRDIQTLRFHVYTNHGERLTLRPERPMLGALREVLVEENNKVAASST